MADHFRTLLDWEDVRVFVALVRYGSLSAAARALTVTHATISRRVQSLEKSLGAKLVERRPNGYVLTPAGTEILSVAREMEVSASKLMRGGADDTPRGLVRVNAPPSLAQGFLAEPLAALTVLHPSLDIDLSSDFRAVGLERREADIAVRFGQAKDSDVIAKLLVTAGFGFYASAQWLKRIEAGEPPTFVGFDEANASLPEAAWLAQEFPRARTAFRGNSHMTQAAAARSGAGVALLPDFVGRHGDGLIKCMLEHTAPSRELWLLTQRDGRKDLPTKTVADFLLRFFSDNRDQFELTPPSVDT
ncbi:transcriptional regulator, LysR family [Burkholderia sp. H160]|nr:transcriptional regulator, LysR family [Burkholderia sp. H160]